MKLTVTGKGERLDAHEASVGAEVAHGAVEGLSEDEARGGCVGSGDRAALRDAVDRDDADLGGDVLNIHAD